MPRVPRHIYLLIYHVIFLFVFVGADGNLSFTRDLSTNHKSGICRHCLHLFLEYFGSRESYVATKQNKENKLQMNRHRQRKSQNVGEVIIFFLL